MKLLVVVDMQNDFLTGALRNEEGIKIIPNVIEEINNASDDTVVVATVDTHFEGTYLNTQEGKKLPIPHCIFGTEGWYVQPDIENAIRNKTFKTFIQKNSFGLYDWPKMLKEYVKFTQFEEIELIGVCTDICIPSNALILKALYPETPIKVKESCCAGTTKENHDHAIATMRSCQIEII